MFLKAAHILPIEGRTLSPGVIHILDGRIREIGDESMLQKMRPHEKVTDLGNVVLMPGFVNAHCHLELTCLRPLTEKRFVPWIKELVMQKTLLTEGQMIRGIKHGVQSLLDTGVTCVGDHISFNTPWEAIVNSPLRGKLFGETLGVIQDVSDDIYSTLVELKKQIDESHSNFTMHVSPHSVHAVHPETLGYVMRDQKGPLSCHLAESQSEYEYFKEDKGDIADLVKGKNPYLKKHTTTGLGYLKENKLPLEKLLLVHGNYLDDEDLKTVKKNNLSVVHCPGSHEFFGHKEFPLEKLHQEHINIALGTDSITSNTCLNFLFEMKKVKDAYPSLSSMEILKMATLNGAKALQMEHEIGSLVHGKKADIVGFELEQGTKPDDAPFRAAKADFLMIEEKIIK